MTAALNKWVGKVLPLWVVVYDHDENRVYYHVNADKAFSAIDSAIREYIDISFMETEYNQLMEFVRDQWGAPCMPIKFQWTKGQKSGCLEITVYHFSFSPHDKIPKLLSACYDKLDDEELKREIDQIFVDET